MWGELCVSILGVRAFFIPCLLVALREKILLIPLGGGENRGTPVYLPAKALFEVLSAPSHV